MLRMMTSTLFFSVVLINFGCAPPDEEEQLDLGAESADAVTTYDLDHIYCLDYSILEGFDWVQLDFVFSDHPEDPENPGSGFRGPFMGDS